MEITLGKLPVIIRQKSVVAFAGLAPMVTNPAAPPPTIPAGIAVIANSIGGFQYVRDSDGNTDLQQAGLFVFNEAVFLEEIRGFCGAASTMTVTVGDADGSHTVTIANAVSANNEREAFARIPVLKGQVVKVVTSAAGIIDLYAVKADA